MNRIENRLVQLPISTVKERIKENDDKILRRKPSSLLDEYSHSVAKSEDWIIKEQPIKTLPRSLTGLISLRLRDEGNALIEETRALNNRHIGLSFETVSAMLISDLDVIDLQDKLLVWAEEITKEVLYKLRYQAKENLYKTYSKAYNSFLREIDTGIAHGSDRMYQIVWSSVTDCIPYMLIDGFFLKPGHLHITHSTGPEHLPIAKPLLESPEVKVLLGHLNLYGIESTAYVQNVILNPLQTFLVTNATIPSEVDIHKLLTLYLDDLVEAFPYLLSSTKTTRYLFDIPGTTCAGGFTFIGKSGFATFYFSDSKDQLIRGMESRFCRGALEVTYDGRISCMMHPWLTLDRMFGRKSGLLLAFWLLKQVHHRVVEDYLKINKHYLRQESGYAGDDSKQGEVPENDVLIYASWIKEAQERLPDTDSDSEEPRSNQDTELGTPLPQIRRNLFFKLLRSCGVEVAQGKGSEIKLLRGGSHPFRLGNHYGPNPTIPSVLAGNILKRLSISKEEWLSALAEN